MNETLELIDIKSIELKQYRSLLYQLKVYTNDRINSYARGTIERREKDGRLKDLNLFDSINEGSIITTKLSAKNVIDAAKIIKEYFDNTNRNIEKINAIADRRKWRVKIVIAAIFAKRVDD